METQDKFLFEFLQDMGFIATQSQMDDIKKAVADDRFNYLESKIKYDQKTA